MQIGLHSVVALDYTLTDASGKVLDSSQGRPPLTYLHGSGSIIPGLEAALLGKTVGDHVSAIIPPEQAYGVLNPALRQTLDREAFGRKQHIEVGMRFRSTVGQQQVVFTVVGFDKDGRVKIDGNHELAGVTLRFEVDVREVRPATEEEISHGHVHGPGGHHH